jgi:hypothetical protein
MWLDHAYVVIFSVLVVAFEAIQSILQGLLVSVKDPEILACAMCSVDIISDEVVMDIASVPIILPEKDVELFRSQVCGIHHTKRPFNNTGSPT